MNKCKNKCSAGLSKCCYDCKAINFCPKACDKDRSCEWSEMTGTERRNEYKSRKQLRLAIIGYILLVVLISAIGIAMLKSKPLIVDLSKESISVDKLVDEQDKVAVIEDLIPNTTSCGVLTTQELDIVCRVVAAEARGEDLQGMMGVAQVIRDRANEWDMTVTEVVTAPSQFAKPYQGKVSNEVRLAVANVLEGQVSVLAIPTTHFHSGEKPYWASSKINRGKIGNHKFYY